MINSVNTNIEIKLHKPRIAASEVAVYYERLNKACRAASKAIQKAIDKQTYTLLFGEDKSPYCNPEWIGLKDLLKRISRQPFFTHKTANLMRLNSELIYATRLEF